MQYFWRQRMNELLIYKTAFMNHRSTMLSERNQTQKDTHCMIPFPWNSHKNKTITHQWCQKTWSKVWLHMDSMKEYFVVMTLVCIPIVVEVMWIYMYVKCTELYTKNSQVNCMLFFKILYNILEVYFTIKSM